MKSTGNLIMDYGRTLKAAIDRRLNVSGQFIADKPIIIVDHLEENGNDEGEVVWEGIYKGYESIPVVFLAGEYIKDVFDKERHATVYHVYSEILTQPILSPDNIAAMVYAYKNRITPALTDSEILERMCDPKTFYKDYCVLKKIDTE